MAKTRGVLYVVWGDKCQTELERSQESVRKLGLDFHVARGAPSANLQQKNRLYDLSPFDQTVFLDTDTIALHDLDYGFAMAAVHGLAMCIAPAANATLHHKLTGAPADLVQYNTGVIFFEKEARAQRLFTAWREQCDGVSYNDQPPFALAVYQTSIAPYVLPLTWNFRPKYEMGPIHGPLKIWHGRQSLPVNIEEYNATASGFARVKRIWPGKGCRIEKW